MKFPKRLHPTAALVTMALFLLGCQDDLPRISLVSEMDIFGHRVEVEGDPQRATPAKGERATITWSIVYPEIRDDNDEHISILALECSMPERYTGRPICAEFLEGGLAEILRDGIPSGADGAAPSGFRCTDDAILPFQTLALHCLRGHTDTTFEVAEDFAGAGRLFTGIVCRNGIPEFGAEGFTCAENDDAEGPLEVEEFYSSVAVQQDDESSNHNPELSALSLRLDGESWPAWEGNMLPTADDCDPASPQFPEIPADEVMTLEVGYAANDREQVDGKSEVMRISHRATDGSFSSSASYLPRDRKADKNGLLLAEVDWETPPADQKSERLIRFYFAVRDGRGGFAATERFACRSQ